MRLKKSIKSLLLLISLGIGGTALAAEVAPAEDPGYLQACGRCHMAYPPGLMLARTSIRLLTGLSDHFGQNIPLEEKEKERLIKYLVDNAADMGLNKYARPMMDSLDYYNEAPLRLLEVPYLAERHNPISELMKAGKVTVTGMGDCQACHPKAAEGSFATK